MKTNSQTIICQEKQAIHVYKDLHKQYTINKQDIHADKNLHKKYTINKSLTTTPQFLHLHLPIPHFLLQAIHVYRILLINGIIF